jgi:gamma-butyrobetaine dioxygenase
MSASAQARAHDMTPPPPTVVRAERAEDGGAVAVSWSDGHESRFPSIQLRHQCACPACGTPTNAVRGIRLWMIPDDIRAERAAVTPDGVRVVWSDDGHTSDYDARWLRAACCAPQERAARAARPTLWTAADAGSLPAFDLAAAESDPETRLRLLEAVRDFGVCSITGAPTMADEAARMIALIGPQRVTHFGTYTLTGKASVDNVGDITDALDPHCDETYRLSTVGVTVFQVLRPARSGGHTTLVDGFEAVRRLRADYPDDFDLLTRVPIPAERRDAAVNSGGREKWYAASMPVIRTDIDGHVTGVRLNERQIGPLDVPQDWIEPTYRALKRLFAAAYDPALRITLPLKAGEGVIFDNQRVLHGRTAYRSETPPRAVLTSSVDIEEFHSSLRLLQERLRGRADPRAPLQGMVG